MTTFLSIKKAKPFLITNYFLGFLVCFLLLKTNFIISGHYQYFWGPYPKAGPFHPIFLVFFFFNLTLFYIYNLTNIDWKNKSNKVISHEEFMIFVFSIFGIAGLDFLPNYGIEIYPFGYIPACLFTLLMRYAAFKYKLNNVNIIIQKGISYSILLTFLSLIYVILIIVFEKLLNYLFGYHSSLLSLLIAFTLGLILIPLRNNIQNFLEKYFLEYSFENISLQNKQLREQIVQSEKYKTLSALASGIVHEIKNPLTSLRTFFEYLPQKKDDPEFFDKFMNITGKEIGRIERLTQELLDFSKPSPPQPQSISLEKILEETLDLVHNDFKRFNIRLNKHFTSKDVRIYADPGKIKQALLNIILNAIDAMPKGGKLTITTDSASPWTKISIKDTGEGINKEDLQKIFEPFHSNKEKGTGLGLTITSQIIEKHNGKINVTSVKGEGTEFIIQIPLSKNS